MRKAPLPRREFSCEAVAGRLGLAPVQGRLRPGRPFAREIHSLQTSSGAAEEADGGQTDGPREHSDSKAPRSNKGKTAQAAVGFRRPPDNTL